MPRWLFSIVLMVVSAFAAHAESIVRLEPQDGYHCPVPCERPAVIFIHGIIGTKATWGDPTSDLYWPKMLSRERDLGDDLDIYQIDYDSNLFSGPAVVPVEEALEQQLDSLMKRERYSKVIFIAHSLGGIMVQSYLLQVKNRYGHRALSRFRMVISLGTPYQGSSLANLARLVTANEQVRVLRPVDVNDFKQLLNHTIDDLQEKHKVCETLRTFAAYEEKPMLGLGIIVDRDSATFNAYESVGFERDHKELFKPKSINPPDRVYTWATRLLASCVNKDMYTCPVLPVQQPSECPGGDFF
jgi:triacylglycerol esterase/lipase EstA (alpha/beta hydrolase family)